MATTQMLYPATTVVGAARVPVPFGLFSVLALRTPTDARWEGGGVTWEFLPGDVYPGVLGPLQGRAPDGTPPSAQVSGLPKTLDAGAESFGKAQPFTAYGHYAGSLMARGFGEAQAYATEHLLTFEERQVEKQLWDGQASPNLQDDDTSVGSYAREDLLYAVADLEDFLSDTYGSQGVLHMSRFEASAAMKHGALEKDRNRLVTKLGTPVVAGVGYPNGEVRATPPLFGYRSEIITSSARPGDLLSRSDNNLTAIAERVYLIGFDPTGVGVATITD